MMNLSELPPSLPFKLMFKWTGSGPGLRPNGVAALFMIKDKKSLYRWIREEVEREPPTLLVPCHGANVRMSAPGKDLLDIFP